MMRARSCLPALMMVGALLVGCQTDKPTQKQQALKQWNSARAGVLGGLARSQYQSGNLDKCRQSLDEALKMDPTNASLHILSGKLYVEGGQLEAGIREFDESLKLEPKNAEAAYFSGVVYQRWQKPDVAYGFYCRASENAPAELAYVLARAEMLVTMDRAPEALNLLQDKVVYFEHSGTIRDAVGQLLLQSGQSAKAAEMFRQAAILAPEDLSIREHLGLALYYSGNARESCDVLSRIVQDEHYARRADLLVALGEAQLQIGRCVEARRNFESAAQIDASLPGVWLGMAKAAMQLGDLKRSELSLKKALALEPASGESYLLLGYLRMKQNQLDAALSAFQSANRLAPRDPVSLCMIGYALEKMNQPQKAMNYYAQALKLKPGDALATKLLAGVTPRK